MRIGYFQPAAFKQNRPQLSHLFALGDGVRGDEADLRIRSLNVMTGGNEPRRHIIQRPAAAAEGRDAPDLGALLVALVFGAAKGRISKNVRALTRCQHCLPVNLQRVFIVDVRRSLEWNARVAVAKLKREPVVHDVVHHPKGHLRNAGGEFSYFYPEELVHIDMGEICHVEVAGSGFQLLREDLF